MRKAEFGAGVFGQPGLTVPGKANHETIRRLADGTGKNPATEMPGGDISAPILSAPEQRSTVPFGPTETVLRQRCSRTEMEAVHFNQFRCGAQLCCSAVRSE